MGHKEDPSYIGAIALGGIIFNILYWGFGFLRPGTTGLTAQAIGREDQKEVYRLFWRSVVVGLSIGITLLFFHRPIGYLFFGLLSGSQEVKNLALDYYFIRILGAPAVISVFGLRGWFFGVQDAVRPMILSLFANIVNIILSWYFVVRLDWSVQGVAYGTLIAQWLTFILAFGLAFQKHKVKIFAYWDLVIFKAEKMRLFFKVNGDMFVRNLGLIFVFTFFTNHSSKMGDDFLAVNQILLQLFYFMSYAVDGFAYASESLVGKYLGAKKWIKIQDVIRKCMVLGLGFAGLFSIAYLIFDDYILALFTSIDSLLLLAKPFMIWLSLLALTGASAFIWDGIYSGATASKELRNSMFLAVVVFVTLFYSLQHVFPNHVLWISMVGFMSGRTVFQVWIYRKHILPQWKASLNFTEL